MFLKIIKYKNVMNSDFYKTIIFINKTYIQFLKF